MVSEMVEKLADIELLTISAPRRQNALRAGLLILATLLTQTSTIGVGDATPGHFSQKQISTALQTVTSELQLGKNWNSNFGAVSSSSHYCTASLLGEGVRSGVHGLYTWFTCSAMHKLEANPSPLTCTGFSAPVWIQPSGNAITYQAISSGTEFLEFRAGAPAQIQKVLDQAFSQVNKVDTRIVIGRAVSGSTSNSKPATQPLLCQ